jgi:hypothetical protein
MQGRAATQAVEGLKDAGEPSLAKIRLHLFQMLLMRSRWD